MRPTRRDMMLGALAAGVWPSVTLAGGAVIREGGGAFGSGWRVVHGASGVRVAPIVERIVAEVDAAMSPYRPASELSAFNRAEAGVWRDVTPAFATVAGAALDMAGTTGGAFDPTVGPLVARLGFGPISGRAGAFEGIEVQERALRKAADGLTLDLCGIAKGHALDRIVGALADAGIDDALVELGGEVRGLGRHPEGRAWAVGIADPRGAGSAWRVVRPGALALATSGHAAQGVTGRVGVSHIVDPKRGRAAETTLLSVSVLASTAMRADALATALVAAGPIDGVALARRLGAKALFIVAGDDGPREVMTGGFRDHLAV